MRRRRFLNFFKKRGNFAELIRYISIGENKLKNKDKKFAENKLKDFFKNDKTEYTLSDKTINLLDNLPEKTTKEIPLYIRKNFITAFACVMIFLVSFSFILPKLFYYNDNDNLENSLPESVYDNDLYQRDEMDNIFDKINGFAKNSLSLNLVTDNSSENKGDNDLQADYITVNSVISFSLEMFNTNDISHFLGNGNLDILITEFTLSSNNYKNILINIKGQNEFINLLGEKTENGYTFSSLNDLNGEYSYNNQTQLTVIINNNFDLNVNDIFCYSLINGTLQQNKNDISYNIN